MSIKSKATEAGPVKRVLLRKHHDITAFTSDNPQRFVLQGVNYNGAKKVLEATNGKILIRVPVEESDEFPPVPKLDSLPAANGAACDIPSKPFLKALKSIPSSRLPILESVRLDIEPPHGDVQASTFHLTTNDLDTISTLSGRSIDGTFPNIDAVIPSEDPKLSITLSAILLQKIAQYAVKHGKCECPVRLSFTDELSPVRFYIPLESGDEASGVVVPIRMS